MVQFLIASPVLSAEKSGMMKGERAYAMTGKISAIDPQSHTIVINVHEGKQIFTVAGPLSPNAVLKQGGRKVALNNFKLGECVNVKWDATKGGQIITTLISATTC